MNQTVSSGQHGLFDKQEMTFGPGSQFLDAGGNGGINDNNDDGNNGDNGAADLIMKIEEESPSTPKVSYWCIIRPYRLLRDQPHRPSTGICPKNARRCSAATKPHKQIRT